MIESSQASLTRAVDERVASSITDMKPIAAHFDNAIADHHLDHAGLDHIHTLAGVAFADDDAAGRVIDAGAGLLGK
jgi:hypothetical protein